MQISPKNKSYLILFPIAAGLFLYSCLRAYYLSFTCDESYSYLEFVRSNLWLPNQFDTMSANNHLLNTWCMKISASIFGNGELSLRIPNVFAHLLFLFYSAKLLVNFQSKIVIVSSFLIVNLNPYLLDFFSVARGYGFSMGLLMGGLYYVYEYLLNNRKLKYAVFSLLFSSLAVLANFTLLNYFIALVLLFLLIELITERKIQIKKLMVLALIPVALFTLIRPQLVNLKKAGCFTVQTFGDSKGFWDDTVNSLIINTLYEKQYIYWIEPITNYFIVLVLIIAGIFVIRELILFLSTKETIQTNNSFLMILMGILICCFISSLLQFKLLGTKFSIGRTALFYIPIFTLMPLFIFDRLIKNNRKMVFIPVVICLLCLTHFLYSMNLSYCLEYKTDKDVKNAMSLLEAYHTRHPSPKIDITLGTGNKSERAINYYREVKNLNWLKPVKMENLYTREHDFYFLTTEALAKLKMDSTQIMRSFSDDHLLINNRKNRGLKEFHKETIHCDPSRGIGNSNPFSQGFSYTISDSLLKLNKNILITLKARVYTKRPDTEAKCVILFENKSGSYSWQGKHLYFELPLKTWTAVTFQALMPKGAKPNDFIRAYIWNPGEINVLIEDMEFKVENYLF